MQRSYFAQIMAVLSLVALPGMVPGDEVTFEQQDGTTYRVTRRVVKTPVTYTEWKEHTETVYIEQYVTEQRDSYRTVYAPLTEYRCEPRWHDWWNPLSRTHIAYHMKPVTRWETRAEKYRAPVTYRRVVPETRIVRTPSSKVRLEAREQIVSRIPVTSRIPVAQRRPLASGIVRDLRGGEPVGGISRLERDPPRRGTRSPAPATIRR